MFALGLNGELEYREPDLYYFQNNKNIVIGH